MSRLKRNLVRRDKMLQILRIVKEDGHYHKLEQTLLKIAVDIPASAVGHTVEQNTINLIGKCASIAGLWNMPVQENYLPEHTITHEWAITKQKTSVRLRHFLNILDKSV